MFVGRLLDGTIYGTWTQKQPNDEFHQGVEELPDDHPEVVMFANKPRASRDPIVELQTKLSELETKIVLINEQLPVKSEIIDGISTNL